MDFTYAAFETFCQRCAGLRVYTLSGYLSDPPTAPPFVLLRADVDYREAHAVVLAQTAHRYGLRGSFYFRHRHGQFDLDAIRAVAALGHETGYHFETLDTCNGDFAAAERLLLDHLAGLRAEGLTVQTVSAHGGGQRAPTYRANFDLFTHTPDLLARAGLLGETTISVDFACVEYVSDALWRWQRYEQYMFGATGQPASLDSVTARLPDLHVGLYINFHPHQWFAHTAHTLFYRTRNRLGRRIVPLLHRIRRR